MRRMRRGCRMVLDRNIHSTVLAIFVGWNRSERGRGFLPPDVVSAHILNFLADYSGVEGFHVCFATAFDLLETTSFHVQCEFHVAVDGFVDGFDSVGILNCELGVVWCLGVVVDDAVPNLSTLSKSSLALGSVVE